MLQKSTQTNLDERLLGLIRNAGYKKPTLLQQSVLSQTLQGRDIAVETGPGEGRTGLLIISLLMQLAGGGGLQGLIIASGTSEVFKVMRQYRRFSARVHGRPHIVGLGTDDNVYKEVRLLSRNPDIAVGTSERIIDHLRRESIHLENVKIVVLFVPEDPELEGFEKDVQYIFSKLPEKYVTQVYCPSLDAISVVSTVLKRPIQITKSDWCRANDLNGTEQREGKMAKSRSGKQSEAEKYVKSILQTIKENENPQELNEFRRTFRRQTPLHLRAYVAAYLIKEAVDSAPGVEGGFKTLFVSIGKNRKIFPKDFIRLFTSQLGITEAEIGDIKVLDNYSFIDIADSHAQKAIDTLNATEFRGRKLTVNYARKKREKREKRG